MAAHGFANITNYDPFSSPARPAGKFSLITCFEVIEHTVSPARLPATTWSPSWPRAAASCSPSRCSRADIEVRARQLVVYRPAQRPRLDLHRRCARPARRRPRPSVPLWRLAARLRRRRTPPRPRAASWRRSARPTPRCGWTRRWTMVHGRRRARSRPRCLARPGVGRRLPLPLDAREPHQLARRAAERAIRCGSASPCRSSTRSATASPRPARSRWATGC